MYLPVIYQYCVPMTGISDTYSTIRVYWPFLGLVTHLPIQSSRNTQVTNVDHSCRSAALQVASIHMRDKYLASELAIKTSNVLMNFIEK